MIRPKLFSVSRSELAAHLFTIAPSCHFFTLCVRQISVQFNAEGNPYQSGPSFMLAGAGKWERALIYLTGAKFQGMQNAGAESAGR